MIILRNLYFKLTHMSWILLTASTIFLIVFSTIMLRLIEPDTFTTYMDSLWFTMTTMLTVGYGDMSPTTIEGRIFTILFLYVVGIGLFATFIGKVMESFTVYRRRKEGGELMYEGKNHIVIIDWSHKAQNAVKEILDKNKKAEIVVIDMLEKLPYVNGNIHYIRGEASNVEVLKKANIQNAKSILIFSDDRIQNQTLTDGKSLMIACAVERIASHVHTVVEIEREEHVENFSHINIDKFILSNGTIAKMVVDAM